MALDEYDLKNCIKGKYALKQLKDYFNNLDEQIENMDKKKPNIDDIKAEDLLNRISHYLIILHKNNKIILNNYNEYRTFLYDSL